MAFPTLPSRPLPQFLTAHPSFSATPSPHFRLPEPCSDYCLTLYALDDRKDIKRIIQDPNHETFRSGGSGMTDAASDEDCDRYEKMFGNNEGSWPFVVIRQISRIAEWSPSDPGSKPPALGLLFFDLNGFRDTAWSDEERKRRRALNAELPDSERHWMGGLFLDTSHRGQGLMTVAYKFALNTWYLGLEPPPGYMASGWDIENVPSQKLHQRVGFKPMGQRPPRDGEDYTIVVSLWSGTGDVAKEDSIYAGIPNWNEI